MPRFPETRESLLVRIQGAQDEEAWGEFSSIYRPVVYRFARQRGLQDADAEDLAQRVMMAVRRAIGSWEADPSKGRFRAWLAKIAENATINALTRRPRDGAVGGTTFLELLAEQPQPDDRSREMLERECQRSLFRWAARRIQLEFRDGTWDAFWLTAVRGVPADEAGRSLGKSVGAVYAARCRVMRRLRDEIEQSGLAGSDCE